MGNLTANSQVGTYSYPTSGPTSVRPHAVSTAGSHTYSYDGNGNMTGGAGRSFTYNLENKPLTITIGGETTTFVYDGDGGRVKKVEGNTTTRYISQLYECENTNCARMIFAGSERVATLLPSGGVHYYHPDHLGSSSVITAETGATVQALTYFPYGATRTNSSSSTPAVNVPYKYTGQELDAATGLYDYGARQYNSELGRFVSPDTIAPDPFNPQDLNRYSYVRNNPFRYIDPTGQEGIDLSPPLTVSGDFGFGLNPGILNPGTSIGGNPSPIVWFLLNVINLYYSNLTQHQWDLLTGVLGSNGFDVSVLNNPYVVKVPEVVITAPAFPINVPSMTQPFGTQPPIVPGFLPSIKDSLISDPLVSPSDIVTAVKSVVSIGVPLVGALGKVGLDAIKELIQSSKFLSKSNKVLELQHAGPKGKQEKDRVFDSLTVNAEVTTKPTSKGPIHAAEVEGGGTVGSRDFSKKKVPTIQIDLPDAPQTKIRF